MTVVLLACLAGCRSVATETAQIPTWYSGGTLRDKTGTEWLQATRENRLATAGNILATVDNPRTSGEFEQLKYRAENLADCITKRLNAPDDLSDSRWLVFQQRPVADTALDCMTTLGYR